MEYTYKFFNRIFWRTFPFLNTQLPKFYNQQIPIATFSLQKEPNATFLTRCESHHVNRNSISMENCTKAKNWKRFCVFPRKFFFGRVYRGVLRGVPMKLFDKHDANKKIPTSGRTEAPLSLQRWIDIIQRKIASMQREISAWTLIKHTPYVDRCLLEHGRVTRFHNVLRRLQSAEPCCALFDASSCIGVRLTERSIRAIEPIISSFYINYCNF